MRKNSSLHFTSLRAAHGHVILGDGTTTLDIHGIGTVTCTVGNHRLTIENVRYVPGLGESIYSLFQYFQTPDHSLHSSFEDGLELIFLTSKPKQLFGIMTSTWMPYHFLEQRIKMNPLWNSQMYFAEI